MYTRYVRYLLVLWVGLATIGQPQPARAAAQITDSHVDYVFGSSIRFIAKIDSELPIQQAFISIQSQGDPVTLVKPVSWNKAGEMIYEYDELEHPLRPFAKVKYWFDITLENGDQYTSSRFDFYYEDNRFDWKTPLESEPFRIHWYEGDLPFAQSILDAARAGLQHIQTILPVQAPSGGESGTIDYYIYANSTDMQKALPVNSQKWVAGHADPDLNVVEVSLPAGPEQRLWIEQRIPHELMHILLFHSIPNGYSNIPTWLNEGLASISELTPDPDYQVVLDNAVGKNMLIPLTSLCQSFPVDQLDQSSAAIAYAESTYFTRYLYRQYGSSGLLALVGSYSNGLDCQRGAETALGIPLTALENQWHTEIAAPVAETKNVSEMLPWFGLLLVVLLVPLMMAFAGLRTTRKRSPEKTGVYVAEV